MKTESGNAASKRKALLNEINVTPFVDVMLVLLIIFMVTAPMLQQGVDISLPETKPIASQIAKKPFILKIKKDQKVYIGDNTIPINTMAEKLMALFAHRQEKTVYLQADKSVPYGVVAEVLVEVKAGGIDNVSLVTVSK